MISEIEKTIEKIISEGGFPFYKSCHCGGTFHKKYKKYVKDNEYLLDWMPRKRTFFFYLNGKVFKSGYDSKLKETLDAIAIY